MMASSMHKSNAGICARSEKAVLLPTSRIDESKSSVTMS
jgi:hypothetical protein